MVKNILLDISRPLTHHPNLLTGRMMIALILGLL